MYCLTVSGNTATVGFAYFFVGDDPPFSQYGLVRVVDTGIAGQDTAHFYNTDGSVDCSQYVAGQPQFRGDFTVTDAPAPPN